jgi:hypothetical protein
VILGHWETTEAGAASALAALEPFVSDVVLSGGDAVDRKVIDKQALLKKRHSEVQTPGSYNCPLVAQAVMSLQKLRPSLLHLAFQHVHYIEPHLLYGTNTIFLPHKAFSTGKHPNRAVHSGYTTVRTASPAAGGALSPAVDGDGTSTGTNCSGTSNGTNAGVEWVPVGALRDQLEFISLLQRQIPSHEIMPTFIFLGGGATSVGELEYLHRCAGAGESQLGWCRLVVVGGIPAASAADAALARTKHISQHIAHGIDAGQPIEAAGELVAAQRCEAEAAAAAAGHVERYARKAFAQAFAQSQSLQMETNVREEVETDRGGFWEEAWPVTIKHREDQVCRPDPSQTNTEAKEAGAEKISTGTSKERGKDMQRKGWWISQRVLVGRVPALFFERPI